MKICDITKFYTETSGGVKTYLRHKAHYLTKRPGWEHLLIVPGPANALCDTGAGRIYTVKGPLIPGHYPYRFLLNHRRVREILAAEAPDLIEMGSPYFVPWVLAASLPRPRPCLTGFYHADFPSTYIRGYGQHLGAWAAAQAEAAAWRYARAVYRRCDLVIASSQLMADKLLQHRIGAVRQVPLGVYPSIFRPDRRSPALRAQLGASDRQRLILYAGRLSYEKGIASLLQGLHLLPPDRYRIVVAGDGPERPALEAFAAAHPNVVYLGYCADVDRLAELYASCDLFIAPGRHETFGLAVLEAFASGLPAVGMRGGAVAELIEPGTGALAKPDDPADLAAQILELCAGDLPAMGRRARALVEARYSWEKTFATIAAIYRELAQKHR